MKMERTDTNRGFALVKFKDHYGLECSLQKSSLATENAIWFGVHDHNAKVMAHHAADVGVKTNETTGWVEYPIPKEALISTRMHLTQRQVKELLPMLKHFAKTGELP